jgi:tripartite-type tricarboxylate transporter receptor subunit TctC
MHKRIICALSVVVLAFLYSSHGNTQTPFYQGKTVRIIVGFSPGGTYDLWARLMAHHMSKHVPETPPSWCRT